MNPSSLNRLKVMKGLSVGLVLILMLAFGQGVAQERETTFEPEEVLEVEGRVTSTITYQGVLQDDGTPVTGSRNLQYRLYSNSSCTTAVSEPITRNGTHIERGLFSARLAFPVNLYNGQALWLKVTVGSIRVACQEILPVPYALSLRPGADIYGEVDHLLELETTTTSGGDYDTLVIRNQSGGGEAVEVAAVNNGVTSFAENGYGVWGDSDVGHGVYGKTGSATKAGVLAKGASGGPDVILAGVSDTGTGDNGVISSDPQYTHSDIILRSYDNIRVDLDIDDDDSDEDFEVYNSDNQLLLGVDESGDIIHGGAGRAAFPRPSYDSGWVAVGQSDCVVRNHNLGGDVDNYVVDLQLKDTGGSSVGISNSGIGGDIKDDSHARGGSWQKLTTTSVEICRWWTDLNSEQLRIRIWQYP